MLQRLDHVTAWTCSSFCGTWAPCPLPLLCSLLAHCIGPALAPGPSRLPCFHEAWGRGLCPPPQLQLPQGLGCCTAVQPSRVPCRPPFNDVKLGFKCGFIIHSNTVTDVMVT